jgi:flagellar assembly factor FliW
VNIESTRFGSIEIEDDAVLTFRDGLIGLPGNQWCLIAQTESTPFFWLHSIDDPSLAVPLTSPWLFFADYEVGLADEDARSLELEGPEAASIFCVVRAGSELDDFTVNLLAPIVIHAARRVGRQVINENGGYGVRQPLFSEIELQQVEAASPGVPVAAWAG